MGILAKQSVYNALLTYLGIGLGAVLTILLYPVVLEPEQYGLTRVLISASIIGAQFSHLGIRNITIRFFPLFRRLGGRDNGLLFLAVTIPLAGFLIFTILFLVLRDPLIAWYSGSSPLFIDYLLYILPITLFILYFDVLNSYLRSLYDSVTGIVISDILLRVMVIALLALFHFGDILFDTFVLLFSAIYGLQPLLMLVAIARRGELNLRPRFDLLRRTLIRSMRTYGLYTLLGGLTTVVVWNVDVIMLGSMIGLEQTAVYAVAFYIGAVIAVPQRAIERIATPLVAGHIRDREWEEIRTIYRKTTLNQTIAGLFILLLIWANAGQILSLLPPVYADGHLVILYIGLGRLIDMATGINGSIIITSRHYRVDLVSNLLLILFTVGSNLLLIPLLGIEGAALATMLSIFLYNLIKLIYVWVAFSMQPYTRAMVWVLLFAGITSAALYLLPPLPLVPNLIITGLTGLILFILPVGWLELSPEMNRLVNRLLGFHHTI